MQFNFNNNKEVVALLGAGSMGLAIAERVVPSRPSRRGNTNSLSNK